MRGRQQDVLVGQAIRVGKSGNGWAFGLIGLRQLIRRHAAALVLSARR
jgi:hypothetical protein